ncbi:MAG: carbon-nitrogen family hydrolase [bacterium]|nr:carbon-nitrogen family hydrolase [bacterium]
MHVVALQLNMAWEDKPTNHQRVRELLADIPIQAGSLIVLPEMFETGFSMNVDVAAQDEDRAGEALLRELAQQFDSAVLGGVAAPVENGLSKNEAVAFAPDGSELVRYQKMQPFSLSGEDQHYPAGSSHRIFEWQGIKISPFVCYDLRFPERFRPAVRDGAEMIVVIACWPAVRSEHWVRLLQARAIENLAPVVGVNRCGREPGLEFDGRSAAFDHMGVPLFEADAREQVIQTEIDIKTARLWRRKFPALRDMA